MSHRSLASSVAAHRLVFDLSDMEELSRIHCPVTLGAALGDFRLRMEEIARRLTGSDIVVEPSPGRDPARLWFAFQPVERTDLPGDPEERLEAIATAGAHLARAVAEEIFGAAVAPRLRPVAVVAPPPLAGTDLSDWVDGLVRSRRAQLAVDPPIGDLAAILNGTGPRIFMQPIVTLSPTPRTLGYEALARGPEGTPLESAGALFETADRTGQRLALEAACAWNALDLLDRLPEGRFLSINASTDLLADPVMVKALARPGVVVELTEHLPLDGAEALLPTVATLREGGALVALDDTGCGFADTEVAAILRPDIVKLCITVVRNAAREAAHLMTIRDTTLRLQDLGCQVLAEGVETAEQAGRLATCGVTLAQGWHYGRPAPALDALASA
jgi:EAL domain-containing protein (putative c-di-GMP-specific phosphodiesterase class I)